MKHLRPIHRHPGWPDLNGSLPCLPAAASAIAALLIFGSGSMVYLLWRPTTLWMFHWADFLGLGELIAVARAEAASLRPPDWLLYSFPHGAWTFFGTWLMLAIWAGGDPRWRAFWSLVVPAMALGGELGQHLRWVPGHFDPADVIAAVAATTLAAGIAPKQRTIPHEVHPD